MYIFDAIVDKGVDWQKAVNELNNNPDSEIFEYINGFQIKGK